MDLMIDCIPSFGDKLNEMLEDDLKALYTSSSSSPSCFDDDQFPGSNFFDDLFPSSCNQSSLNVDPFSSTLNSFDDTYNSIINSSSLNSSHCSYQSSPLSSACISTVSSSAPSPLSLSASSCSLTAALASTNFHAGSNCSSNQSSPICLSPNQFNTYGLDDFTLNTNSSGQNHSQSKYIQDGFAANNYSLYSVVNPMDINRNYAVENNANKSLTSSNSVSKGVQLPSVVNVNRLGQGVINKAGLDLNENQHNKRCKFSHNQLNVIKQEPINSDGESSHSNESDSNSNFSNSNCNFKNSDYQPKKVIIATKFEPLFNINTPGTQVTSSHGVSNGSILLNNSQISVIKIPNKEEAKNLQMPINLPASNQLLASKNDNPPNTKTIIQYNKLINGNSNPTIKQIKNRQNSTSSQNGTNNQNGSVQVLRSDGKVIFLFSLCNFFDKMTN